MLYCDAMVLSLPGEWCETWRCVADSFVTLKHRNTFFCVCLFLFVCLFFGTVSRAPPREMYTFFTIRR